MIRRDLLIVACAISAGIHGALAPEHGGSFVAAAGVLTVLAAALTAGVGGWVAPAAAAGVFAALIGGYALAVTTGLPLVHPEREAVGGLGLATKAVEAAGLVAATGLLLGRRPAPQRPIPVALTAMIAVFSTLVALGVSGGHSH